MAQQKLHPDAQKVCDLIVASGRPPIETLSPPEARVAYAASRAVLQPDPEPVAEVVALEARDRGGPRLVHQLLVYPGTDMRMDWPSAEQLPLTRAGMRWFIAHSRRSAADEADWRASPLRAKKKDDLDDTVASAYDRRHGLGRFDGLDAGRLYPSRARPCCLLSALAR